ncbi:hypothetical protein C7S20_11855 [Christiangramia fulva]|uniref:Secreted protein n=1 Tax=Christiangramia fulva TaxID=2126553 RepID=A0A2R3Z6J9_9FLAO|nr:hypothetical protein [Christiangramia fulva]AVR45889.1 hypothetical protein C7S20_11855 [Christiangramia fulva]
MKSVIFSLLLLVAATFTQAQEITQLDEAEVGFASLNTKITRVGNTFSYKVKETYTGEFIQDPIAFMKANFDIQNFIEENEGEDYDTYLVSFSCSKGSLHANFNKEGDLVNTSQKFINILLPHEIRQEVYRNNIGWTVTKNKYVASGNGDRLEKEKYRIKLEKDGQKKIVKLDPMEIRKTNVASN